MKVIKNQVFDEERALYNSRDLLVVQCAFDGPADGESAFKECADIEVKSCFFNLRYPFWHVSGLTISDSEMTPLCRAAIWYSDHISISGCNLHGIKALRECSDITLSSCHIVSPEFGWSARNITMKNCSAQSEYFLMRGENLSFSQVDFKGKYSFQYVENAIFEDCTLDTKDAFWHSKNVTVKNSVIKGEYLAWYSEGLTLINCKIIGTQPLCYCKDLTLIDCEMIDTDLAFEKSQVQAALCAPILSIKNPLSGMISVPAVGELIMDDPKAEGKVILPGSQNTVAK